MKRALVLALLAVSIAIAAVVWLAIRAEPIPSTAIVRTTHEVESASPDELETAEASELTAPAPERVVAEPESEEPVRGKRARARQNKKLERTPGATTLVVRIVGKERGQPVADQHVCLRTGDQPTANELLVRRSFGKVGEALLTDQQGRAEFEVSAGVAYRVSIVGHDDTLAAPALKEHETREVSLAIATDPDAIFHGRLVDGETALPIARGTLRFDADERTGEETPDVAVSRNGEFALPFRSWQRRSATASAPGYASALFRLEANHDTPDAAFQVRMFAAAALEVVVTRNSLPAKKAKVELSADPNRLEQVDTAGTAMSRWQTWSLAADANGRAEFTDLPPNVPLNLTVHVRGQATRRETTPIRLTPREHRRVDVVLGSATLVAGRVTDSTGNALAKCTLWRVAAQDSTRRVLDANDPTSATVRTGPDGRFEFKDVPPGRWLIGLKPESGSSRRRSKSSARVALAENIGVALGQERVDLVLVVDRDLYIEGMVLDDERQPVARCAVAAERTDVVVRASATTDELGHFRIGPLLAGSYSLRAGSRNDEHSQLVTATAGDTAVVVQAP